MKLPSLKHRKPIVYISLGFYVTLVAFIIAESCLQSGVSGLQSGLLAQISAFFVNLFEGPQVSEIVKPSAIGTVTDSSYLGNGNIALGTTSLISIEAKYPDKPHSDDVYDRSYVVENVAGNKDHYSLTLSSHTNKNSNSFFIDVRITTNNISDEAYKLNVKVAETLNYEYTFHIVEKAKPTNFEIRLNKTNLKIGETSQIDIKLNPKEGDNHSDPYLRRYYDTSKIDFTSSNTTVATVDKFGVIHGHAEGNATITCGEDNYNVTVSNEHITKPSENTISLAQSGQASLLDYDYVFEKDENPDNYSLLVYPNFEDTSLEDQSVSYELGDPVSAIIAPYKYDEDGFPIYKDDDNKNCVRICGYRINGNVTLTCYSNNDNSIKKELNVTVGENLPDSMKINYSGTKNVYVNDQLIISGSFSPKNVFQKAISVEVNNPEAVQIINNNTQQVTINTKQVANVHVTVKSIANPSLIKEFDISISVKEAINDDNFADFHQFIRKFAGHFFLFLVTAVFGLIFFVTYFEDFMKMYIYLPATLILGFAVAGISELIQKYIQTRSGSMLDVGIDFLGYFVGTLLAFIPFLITYLVKRKKNKQN